MLFLEFSFDIRICDDERVIVRFPSNEMREIEGIEDIILLLQQNRLQWYRHVLRKEDNDWVKTEETYGV